MLATAFSKAFSNLFQAGVLKYFLISVLVYVFGWLGLSSAIGVGIAELTGTIGAEKWFVGAIASFSSGVLAWFLFPLLYPILIGFFDEQVAEAIELKDYPQLPKATPPFWPTLAQDAWFSVKAILINLLCLPLYLIPLFGQVLYYGLNGYLLGAQFFRMSAGRRETRANVQALIAENRGKIITAGVGVMLAATIPFLNLAAPILGVAVMLHLYHLTRKNDRVTILNP